MPGLLEAGHSLVILARPSDGEDFTPTTVTPGLAGAVTMLLLGVAVLLLALDMSRRIRRVQARARVEERLRAEDEAALSAEGSESDETGADGGSDETGAADRTGGPDRSTSGVEGRDADGPGPEDAAADHRPAVEDAPGEENGPTPER